MDNITVAFDRKGNTVTTGDLEVGGAMTAWMRNSINPTSCSTMEYQPCMVHAGPFANIAVGQSSIIGDRIGLKMFDYHVTESGFAADIGFEKFWNVKCRLSGLKPHVSVLTITITISISGINPVVCINAFHTDTKEEIVVVRKAAEAAGARCAVSAHWAKGGDGALELGDAVMEAYEDPPEPHPPTIKGVPKGWHLPIRDVLIYSGAKFLCACAGTISLMPGTGSDPAFRRVDIDTKAGKVQGLF